jgi:hypothetical protein
MVLLEVLLLAAVLVDLEVEVQIHKVEELELLVKVILEAVLRLALIMGVAVAVDRAQ